MKAGILESHAGGVVRVAAPPGAWGAVPLKLIEDKGLSLEARGVAIWLATRPGGWQISVSHLLGELGLGRDRWRRIAAELESAKYLSRRSTPSGAGGRWVWEIVFCSLPAAAADAAPSPEKRRSIAPSTPGHRREEAPAPLATDPENGIQHNPKNERDVQALAHIREFPVAAVRQATAACAALDDRGRAFPSAVLRHLRRQAAGERPAAAPAWALAPASAGRTAADWQTEAVEGDMRWTN